MGRNRLQWILLLLVGLMVAAVPALAEEQTHTVQPGENLYRISLTYGVDMKIIAQANNLANTALVYVGQKLIIPDMSAAVDNPLMAAEPTYYTVQPGDSLLRIANLYGLTVQQLAQINNLTDVNHIVPGQELTVFTQPLTEITETSATTATPPTIEATPVTTTDLQVTPAAVTIEAEVVVPATEEPAELPVSGTAYTIQPGETLASIAMQHGVTWPAIVQANNITDPNQIMPGQSIIIPTANSITDLGIISSTMPMTGPTPTILEGKQIIVDLSDQRTYAYENGVLVRNTLVSTGLPATPTVLGNFTVQRQYEAQLMSGPGYYLPNVQWISYFYAGYAIHGTYWHNNFGQPMSHGCVNMPNDEALWYYNFASVGTPVLVQL